MTNENRRRTPTQDRARVTVEAILDATAQLLVEEGYARTSTNRVARRAGVSVGSLYHYFGDKDAIVDALVERVAERQLAALNAALSAHAALELEPAVRGLVSAVLASQRIEAELSHVLLTQCARGDRGERIDLDQRWKRRMTELLAAQMLAGEHPVRPRRVELAAYVVVHGIFAIIRDALYERPELIRGDALTEELTELVVRYLRPDG